MKRSINILILCLLCISCSPKLDDIWEIEKKIQYENGITECGVEIDKVINLFDKAIKRNKTEWNYYGQLCQYYKKLYVIHKFLSEKDFYEKEQSVYDRWFLNNSDDLEHLIPYGFLLIVNGRIEKGNSILLSLYNSEYEYNFENPSQKDIKMFFCGIVLGKINRKDYEDTVYVNCFDFSISEITEMFTGS